MNVLPYMPLGYQFSCFLTHGYTTHIKSAILKNIFSDEELKRCREPWTIIAFQDTPFNSSNMENFTALATSYEPGRKYIEPLQNFWDLDQIDAENPAIMIDGGWKFRLI